MEDGVAEMPPRKQKHVKYEQKFKSTDF